MTAATLTVGGAAVAPSGAGNGVEIWRGRSRFDGAPIVVLMSGLKDDSANGKTGAMLQVWILRADVKPSACVRRGLDASACGMCPARGSDPLDTRKLPLGGMRHGSSRGRYCYVVPFMGPDGVWGAWRRGKYPAASWADVDTAVRGRAVRLGAYGDPGMAPTLLMRRIVRHAASWTGYTHQWDTRRGGITSHAMASVDTVAEAKAAWRRGMRTFRIRAAGGEVLPGEVVCPASAEAGKKATCATCGLCNGTAGRNRFGPLPSVVIIGHGGICATRTLAARGIGDA